MATRGEIREKEEKSFLDFISNLQEYEIVDKDFKYINVRQRCKIRHITCGTEWEPEIRKFWGENSRCPNRECFREKRTSHLRKEDKFYKLFLDGEYKIIESNFKYYNKRQKVKIQHSKCGTIFEPIIDNFVRNNTRCPKCKYTKRQEPTIERLSRIFIDEEEYKIVDKSFNYENTTKKIQILHKKCGKVFEPTLHNFLDNGSRCPNCCNSTSRPESDICEYIGFSARKSPLRELHRNTKIIIPPLELDIYIPEKNLAIEYNGLYWHSEDKKGEKYHKQKTDLCNEKGIQLFHIFSDEWLNKQDIVKSMLNYKLGISENVIKARKCVVREIFNKESKEFFNKIHISGNTKSIMSFGLFYNDKLISCISLRKPFHKKYENTVEIARFSSELNTHIQGGFGKLFKYVKEWCINNNYNKILTYADLRYGTGNVYAKNGFNFIGWTGLDFWYTDGQIRYNRFKFRAQFGKSEKQIAEENGVSRVYGCGSNIYEYSLI